jgi:hypothetical protein
MSKEYRVQGAPSGRGFDAPLIARRVRRTRHELGARGTSAIRVQSACPRRRASACSRDDRSPRPHAQGRRPIRGRRGCAGAVLRWDLSHPHTREPCSPKASEPPVRSARPDGECIDGCRCRDPRSRLPPFRAPRLGSEARGPRSRGPGGASVMPLPPHRAAWRKPGDGSGSEQTETQNDIGTDASSWANGRDARLSESSSMCAWQGGVRVSLPSYGVTLEPAALDRKQWEPLAIGADEP